MKNTSIHTSGRVLGLLGLGLMVTTTATAQPQPPQPQDRPYDQYSRQDDRHARQRELLALQDDLRAIDDGLTTMNPRNPRYDEFQNRSEGIRAEVTALANDLNRRAPNRISEGEVQIASLRLKISTLRDDIEDAQARRARAASYRLPPGTEIEIVLNEDVTSRSANINDRVDGSIVTAIRLDGRTIIPAGALISGTVREVRSRNRGQKDGWLKLDFDTINPERGPSLAIRSHVVSISETHSDDHDHTLRNGGLGALLGGVLGGIIDGKKGALIGAAVGAGGGVLSAKGDDVDLPEGTLVTIRLDAPTQIARR